MHEAYELSHLLTVTVQIETITAYEVNGIEKYLILGTRQGSLLMYSVSQNASTQKYEVQLLRLCKTFSKKPIQQIEVIPEDNLLLCLTDNLLTSHNVNSSTFQLVKTYTKTKGATLFAADVKKATSMTGEDSTVVRLCVVVKRKLQVYYGKNGEFKQHLYDINLNDVPKLLLWGQQYICVGYKGEYTLIDITSSKPKDLFPTSSSRSLEPTIEKYTDTCFMLGKDQTTVLVDEAVDVDIKQIAKWNEAPIGLCWDSPYLIGLLQDHLVVQTVEPTLFIQTIGDLNKARLLYRCKPGFIFISSIGQVWCITLVDVAKQRQMLLQDKQFQLAIKLTELSDATKEEKDHKIRSIKMLNALDLFDNKKFSESMKEFKKLGTDPADVIKLFPEFITSGEPENKKSPGENELQGKDLENALMALIEYLREIRLEIHTDELIDTTLLKCYLGTKNDALVASLLRRNNCSLEQAEAALLAYGKYSELIILYQTKGQHTKALQLLREHALQKHSSLKGYSRTKNYLQQLGSEHLNLIFKFSDWLLKEQPEEGLKIFTEDITEVENLPRAKVLDFFLREHESLVIPYLEHVIHSWNDTNPLFHKALIMKYKDKLTEKSSELTKEEEQHIRGKLLNFLETSNYYTPELVLVHFPHDHLLEERALVLGKLEQHEQVLAIYVQILGDIQQALKYCDSVSIKGGSKSRDIYVYLIRLLMNPDNDSMLTGPLASLPRNPLSSMPDLETTMKILEQHADKIDPLKALDVLPDDIPISQLKFFLTSALENQVTLKRKAQILKGLLYSENQQAQELRSYHESECITITDYNVCPVCKKRFGNQSAFIRYPNGEIVHFSCKTDK